MQMCLQEFWIIYTDVDNIAECKTEYEWIICRTYLVVALILSVNYIVVDNYMLWGVSFKIFNHYIHRKSQYNFILGFNKVNKNLC